MQAQQLHAVKVDGVIASIIGPLVQLPSKAHSPTPQGRNCSPAKLCLMNLSGLACSSGPQVAPLLLTLSGQLQISNVLLEDYKALNTGSLNSSLLYILSSRFSLARHVNTHICLCKQELADWLVTLKNADFACICKCAHAFGMHPNQLLC